MKKSLKIVLSILLCAMSLVFFFGCDRYKANHAGELQFDTKYIEIKRLHEENSANVEYYIFHSDGTGEFHNVTRWTSGDYTEYSIYFKYTYLDADGTGVMCFFDSMSDYTKHIPYLETETTTTTPGKETGNWSAILSVSKDIVMSATSLSNAFINENFIEQIPNYEP